MSLNFQPLCWIYHDGWKFKETKIVELPDDTTTNAPPKTVDLSKIFYQKGHVHLFMKDVKLNENGPITSYTGTQEYEFNIVDEWGPNSDDPNQSRTNKLIGKPIWYFYVEQYWRRMYIQPWDQVDKNCKLPLNQEKTYDKYIEINYYQELIDNHNVRQRLDSSYNSQDIRNYNSYYSWMGFNDYVLLTRHNNARKIFADLYCTQQPYYIQYIKDKEYRSEYYFNVINNITIERKDSDGNIIQVPKYYNDFWFFYESKANEYNGFIDNMTDILINFINTYNSHHSSNRIIVKDFIRGEDGYIYIPKDETIGHIGIKYDASKPCHSLGPFMQGGQFYFFNTVVNRTMPCEYWLDEQKKTRQYYLKQKHDKDTDSDTSGGETWTFSGDDSHFSWCYDTFDETIDVYKDYEPDSAGSPNVEDAYGDGEWQEVFEKHRLRNLYPSYYYYSYYHYCYTFQNAKRIKNDKFMEINNNNFYFNGRYIGDNSKMVHDSYNEADYINTINSQEAQTHTYFDEDGEHTYTYQPSASQSTNKIHWELKGGHWSGWYEKDEIILCAKDKKWYKRTWAPYLYDKSLNNIFQNSGINNTVYDNSYYNYEENYSNIILSAKWNINNEKPTWNWNKRQSFPNPPPYLCINTQEENEKLQISTIGNYLKLIENPEQDFTEYNLDNCSFYLDENNEIKIEYKASSLENAHMARDEHYYEYSEDNRIHLMHWEYCHYYNLMRIYNKSYEKYYPNTNYNHIIYIYIVPYEDLEYQDSRYKYESRKYVFREQKTEDYIPSGNDWYDQYSKPKYWTQYTCQRAILDWETYIDIYQEQNDIIIMTIEQENQCFNDFIAQLPYQYSPLYYEDIYDDEGNFQVCYKPLFGNYYDDYDEYSEYPSFITFDQFQSVWKPLTEEEIEKLGLDGDLPKRNKTPYYLPPIEELFPITPQNPSSEQDKIIINTDEDWDSSSDEVFQNLSDFKRQEYHEKRKIYLNLKSRIYDQNCPSTLCSEFFPRVDDAILALNKSRGEMSPPKPPFEYSPLDETDQLYDTYLHPVYNYGQQIVSYKSYVKTYVDPYRSNSGHPVDPVENWKKYFQKKLDNQRQIYTIPDTNVVKGDKQIKDNNDKNFPVMHHRENSYCAEDGARRLYSDENFISPIIEYQKIIRLNWERLPGNEQEQSYLQEHYADDPNGNWGDGFEVKVSIPFTINNEIQSPFSNNSKITQPIGKYFHNCVKPENQMRYKIDFYDSLEKIRKYDFPNYLGIMYDFQTLYMPQDVNKDDLRNSLYQQDFNNYQSTLEYRENSGTFYDVFINDVIPNCEACHNKISEKTGKYGVIWTYFWKDLLEEYWKELNQQYKFSQNPIVKDRDCYNNPKIENSFVNILSPSGKNYGKCWREATTYLLPSQDKVAYVQDYQPPKQTQNYNIQDHIDAQGRFPGYLDSNGYLIKGGKVVEWNEPVKGDGRWTEQCLGAIVKAKCVLVLEDSLGYRWKQEISDTSMKVEGQIRGMDYDTGDI